MADDQPWKIPPIVQELAAGVREPPSRYVVREQDRPAAAGAAMPEPIDPRLSAEAHDGADEAAKLRSALQNWGLFLAVGHGMEPSFLAETMKVTRGFYKLPTEEKQKYSNLVNGKEFRNEGYGNDMVVSESQILDWCDRFFLIVEPEPRRVHSLWPTQPPSFSVRELPPHAVAADRSGSVLLLQRRPARVHSQVQGNGQPRPREPCQAAGPARGLLLHRHDGRGGRDVRQQAQLLPALPRAGPRLRPEAPHSNGSVITGVWYDVPIVPDALLVNVGGAIAVRDVLEGHTSHRQAEGLNLIPKRRRWSSNRCGWNVGPIVVACYQLRPFFF